MDRDALTAYMNPRSTAAARWATIVVWGSAGSRNVPEGFSRDRAWQQMVAFLRMAGPTCARRATLWLPSSRCASRRAILLIRGAEAFRLVREVDHPNVKMIIDYYHLQQEHEDPQILEQARDAIVHLHFANPKGRVWPKIPRKIRVRAVLRDGQEDRL